MLLATADDQLIEPKKTGRVPDVSREQIAKLERELAAVQSRTLFVEETYGIDNLHLTVAKSFLAKILNKPAIVRWLKANQPDYLAEFQQIADLVSLNEAAPA